jgi:hypothetical protein
MADPADTIVFRNNTYIYFPAGRTYTSPARTLTMDNYTLRISDNYTQVYVYNNILVDVFGSTSDTKFNDYNLYRKNTQNRVLPRFTIMDSTEQFSAPAAFDGRLLSTSPCVNAGTWTAAINPLPTLDFYGTPRDNRPDLGAYELPGQNPPVEPVPVVHPGQKTVFVDDFTDGDLSLDPWLDSTGVQGLSWSESAGESCHYTLGKNALLDGNSLFGPGTVGSGWLWAGQGTNWLDYTLDFDATNAYLTIGDGPLLLARDKNNCYWLDISRDNGRLIRILGGTQTVLDTNDTIEMPHSGKQVYRVAVVQNTTSITITVDVGRNGSIEFTVIDTSAAARALFGQGGGLGFHRDYPSANLRLTYDNVRATVSRFAAVGIAGRTTALAPSQNRLQILGNPAAPQVVICLDPNSLPSAATLNIYDISGTRMRSLGVPARVSSIVWDGTSDWGQPVPNGMYVIEIVTSESRETISVMLTR